MLSIKSVLISAATELDCQVDISPVLHVDIVNVLSQRMLAKSPVDSTNVTGKAFFNQSVRVCGMSGASQLKAALSYLR